MRGGKYVNPALDVDPVYTREQKKRHMDRFRLVKQETILMVSFLSIPSPTSITGLGGPAWNQALDLPQPSNLDLPCYAVVMDGVGSTGGKTQG